jgi:hypothetical protein
VAAKISNDNIQLCLLTANLSVNIGSFSHQRKKMLMPIWLSSPFFEWHQIVKMLKSTYETHL